MLAPSDGVTVDVTNLQAARTWYSKKLGLGYASSGDDGVGVVLGYSRFERRVYLRQAVGNPSRNTSPDRRPIIFAYDLAATHESLSSQGVATSCLQIDSGGNQFFRFVDLEGNELEVCQVSEPDPGSGWFKV